MLIIIARRATEHGWKLLKHRISPFTARLTVTGSLCPRNDRPMERQIVGLLYGNGVVLVFIIVFFYRGRDRVSTL